MPDETLTLRSTLPVSAQALESYHHLDGAFERLNPPFARVEVVRAPAKLVPGARAEVRVPAGPLRLPWVAEIREVGPGFFTDEQVRGPFAAWRHEHRFRAVDGLHSELVDNIRYRLPGGPLAGLGRAFARRRLEQVFRYRHAVTALDLVRFLRAPQRLLQRQRVLVTGASGLVGRALVPLLRMTGGEVVRLTRRHRGPGEFAWDPAAGTVDPAALQGVGAVVHLAGENVAQRWTPAARRRILESRAQGTRTLVDALRRLPQPPVVWVSASGSAAYAFGGGPHAEDGPPGDGFLAEVTRAWEAPVADLAAAGVRAVVLRFGVLLDASGGALAKMLPAFRLGFGGPLGAGTQRMSWLALEDAVDLIHTALGDSRYEGVCNAVAPESVTNAEFAAALNRALGHKGGPALPAAVLRAVFGRMADETLLADNALVPARLKALGYRWRHPTLAGALAHTLGYPG